MNPLSPLPTLSQTPSIPAPATPATDQTNTPDGFAALVQGALPVGPIVRTAQRALCTLLASAALLGALAPNTASAYDSAPLMGKVAATAQAQHLASQFNLNATATQLQALQRSSVRLEALENVEHMLYQQEDTPTANGRYTLVTQKDGSAALKAAADAAHSASVQLRQDSITFKDSMSKDVLLFAKNLMSKGFYQRIPNDLQVKVDFVQPGEDHALLNAFASTDFERIDAPLLEFEFPYASFLYLSKSTMVMSADKIDAHAKLAQRLGHDFQIPTQSARADQSDAPALSHRALIELTTLHELGHVEHAYRAHVFEHPQLSAAANAAISAQIKYDFQHANEQQEVSINRTDNVDSVHGLLLENYADAHMALSYLKLHGHNPQTLSDLNHFAVARQHNSALYTLEHAATSRTFTGFVEGYRTHDALQFIIQNAAVLDKMPTQNISQAASFIASSFTHALTSDLVASAPKALQNMSDGAKLINANTLTSLEKYSSTLSCSNCGVNTKDLLQFSMFPQSASAMMSAPTSLASKRTSFAQNKHSKTNPSGYQQVQMPVTSFPTIKSLGM